MLSFAAQNLHQQTGMNDTDVWMSLCVRAKTDQLQEHLERANKTMKLKPDMRMWRSIMETKETLELAADTMWFLMTHLLANPAYRDYVIKHTPPGKMKQYIEQHLIPGFNIMQCGLAEDATKADSPQKKMYANTLAFVVAMCERYRRL